jgi:predicted DNA-binding protein (MmcQ/YjbR family)
MTSPTNLERLRELCAGLPEVHEEITWGEDLTIRVGKKIFCFPGEAAFTVKADKAELLALLDDPRITLARYVGRFGWITVRLDAPVDWDQVGRLIRRSYRLIAPKKLAAQVPD